jgi:hypothetical protein
MIQPNELMIGNTFLWKRDGLPNEYISIYNINRSTVRVYTDIDELDEVLLSYEDLLPIALTEDILLKCGFEVSKSDDTYEYDMYSIQIANNKTLVYYKCPVTQMETGEVTLQDSWFFDSFYNICVSNDDNPFWNKPKYLHQLQNLYFALTNKELKKICIIN